MHISNKNKRSKLFFILLGLVFLLAVIDVVVGYSSGYLKYYTLSYSFREAIDYFVLMIQSVLLKTGVYIMLLAFFVSLVAVTVVSIRLSYRLFRKNLYYSLNILSEGIEYKFSVFPSMPERFSRTVFLSKESIDYVIMKKRTFTTQVDFFLKGEKHRKNFCVFLPFKKPSRLAVLVSSFKDNGYYSKEVVSLGSQYQAEMLNEEKSDKEGVVQLNGKNTLSNKRLIENV